MDDRNKPLISSEDDLPETKKCNNSGCLGNLFTIAGLIFIIIILFHACSDDTEDISESSSIQGIESSEPVEISAQTPLPDLESPNNQREEALSSEAQSIENLLFHRLYTEMGTVQIHHFPERDEALEWLAAHLLIPETYDDLYPVNLADPLFGKSYYYITADVTDLYYIGETKDNRPDGFGTVIGMSTGEGTYDLAGAGLIYYVGNFKNGMMDGYGILFAADEANITYACQDAIQIMQDYGKEISEDTGEKLANYLFDYVAYEGFFDENKKNGKGNEFGFYWLDDAIRFNDMLNPPIEGYLFGPVYPNVTMGEYDNGELEGEVKIYKSNHLVYDGEMKNGKENGYGTIYYSSGPVEYDGEFKNGKPNGDGTYYDIDGTIIYSGKWKNGDYAH